jgi:hypothetical protein
MRNLGIGDASQNGLLTFATTASSSSLTYTQTNSLSPVGTVVLPAGSYVSGIIVDVTVAFNAGTNNTITIALSATPGTAGTVICTHTSTAAPIAIGRYTVGSVGFAFTAAATANLVNVSTGQTAPTDQVVQAFFTGTGTAASTGVATISINYLVRNPDGGWYQQSPVSPITSTTILPLTY